MININFILRGEIMIGNLQLKLQAAKIATLTISKFRMFQLNQRLSTISTSRTTAEFHLRFIRHTSN
jgi:hypothetical protein